MELVEPECFGGLSPSEKRAQTYLAVYTAAGDDTLPNPDCFLSLRWEYQEQATYAALYALQ